MSDDLATQDVLDQQLNDGADDGSQGAEDEPFLPVNDRTVYKTREDAIKGYTEAQKTITSLSEYQKVAKEFGISDPKTIKTLFLELLDRREKEKAAKTQTSQKPTAEGDDEEQLTPELKAAIKFLQKNAARAGLMTKAEAAELQKKLEAFEGSSKQSEEAQANALVAEGQETLTGLLTAGKVTVTDEQRTEMEDNIKAWINGSEDRIAKWWGTPVQRQALIKQGFDRELKAMGINPAAAVTAQGKTKAQLMSRTARPLPRDGAPGKGKNQPVDPKQARRNIHQRAWAEVQKAMGNDAGDE